MIRHAVIGPAGEVELLDLSHLVESTLREEKRWKLISITSVNGELSLLRASLVVQRAETKLGKHTHPLQSKSPDDVLGQGFDLHKRHLEISVHLGIVGPVLVALDLLEESGEMNRPPHGVKRLHRHFTSTQHGAWN